MPTGPAVLRRLALALGVAAFAIGGALGSAAAQGRRTLDFPIDIPVGVEPTHFPAEVTATALERLGASATIDVVRARASLSDVAQVEPLVGPPGPDFPDIGVIWIVRAHGHFVARHHPPGSDPLEAATGFLLISDRSGGVIGMGLP